MQPAKYDNFEQQICYRMGTHALVTKRQNVEEDVVAFFLDYHYCRRSVLNEDKVALNYLSKPP